MFRKKILILVSLVLGIGFTGGSPSAGDSPSDSSKSSSGLSMSADSPEKVKALAEALAKVEEQKECRQYADKIKSALEDCKNMKAQAGDNASKELATCAEALDCGTVAVKPKDPPDTDDQENGESSADTQSERKVLSDMEAADAKAAALKNITTKKSYDDNADKVNLEACKTQSAQRQADSLDELSKKQLETKDQDAKRVAELQKEIVDLQQKIAADASQKNTEINKLTLENQVAQAQIQTQVQSQNAQAGMALDNIKTKQNQLTAQLLVINGGTEYQAALIDFNMATQRATADCRKQMGQLGAQNKLTNSNLSMALGAAAISQSGGGSGGITANFCNSNFEYVSALQSANQKLALVRTRLAEETVSIANQQADLNQQASRIVQNSKIQMGAAEQQAAAKITANQITIKGLSDQLKSAADANQTSVNILNKQIRDAQQEADQASQKYAETEGKLATLKDADITPQPKDPDAKKYGDKLAEVLEGAKDSGKIVNCTDLAGKKNYDSFGNKQNAK